MDFAPFVTVRRGPLIIALMLLVAGGASLVAVWYRAHAMRRALAYWGVEQASLVANAPEVEAIRLGATGMGAAAESSEARSEATGEQQETGSLTRDGATWLIDQRRDATHARGLANLRQMLLQDQAYDWEAADGPAPQWLFVLRFVDAGRTTSAWFAPREMRIGRDGTQASLKLDPGGARELLSFFREQFDAPE